jgi:parallel beta-helix repeat protein
MFSRAVAELMLALLLISMLLGKNVQLVSAVSVEVRILSDGSVSPSTAPVQRNGDIYTLTGNITASGDGIHVERDNVILDGAGYTIQGALMSPIGSGTDGIYVESRKNVTVRNFKIERFMVGIGFYGSSNSTACRNDISASDWVCINVAMSSDNIVVWNNTLTDSQSDGIDLWYSTNSRIEDNNIVESAYNGISLVSSANNYVCENNVTANTQNSINIYSSSKNDIWANNIASSLVGLGMTSSSENSIIGNTITANSCGIAFYQSDSNNIIAGNIIANNSYGIYLSSSSENMIYHNDFANNFQQTFGLNTVNSWDHGYPEGGNHWSDYEGADLDNDGIGDTPYNIDINNADRYPLMQSATATVCLYPFTVSSEVGQLFNVRLVAFNLVNLWAWQAGLRWDPTLMECTSWQWGDLKNVAQMSERSPLVIDAENGAFFRPALESTLRGSGTSVTTTKLSLLTVTFKIIKAGKCDLTLSNLRLVSQDSTPVTYYRWSDTNNDGAVDVEDVRLAQNCWETGNYNSAADFDGNGKVDITDLSIVTSDFGKNSSDPDWGVTKHLMDIRTATTDAHMEARPSQFLLNIPYHHQIKSYYCGPAALEEVFHYYGPDIPQIEIADAARTAPDGTYTPDMVRAAHFSNLSTSVGRESPINYTGYTTRTLGYAALECGRMTVDELKSVIAAGYPVIVLTTWHFRVAVGYDSTRIIFQDPYYGPMYQMNCNDFSTDWDYSGHWALLVSPWHIDMVTPHNVLPGDQFNVTATVTYPWVPPFPLDTSPATAVNATIELPTGLSLLPNQTLQKTLDTAYLTPGQSFTVTWGVQAEALGNYRIGVEAEGLVSGWMPPLPSYNSEYTYEDRIGGNNQSTMAVTSSLDTSPPVTTEDYDDSWHNCSFAVNLTASDDISGVLETYYRINGGPEKTLSLNGQPVITTSGTNNTLEYWSTDWAGNEELPHKFLNNIKLDTTIPSIGIPVRTPATEVQPNQQVKVAVSATDAVSGIRTVTLAYTLDDWATWTVQGMTLNASTALYEASIPGQPAGTFVKFSIEAFDQAGNAAVRIDQQNLAYHVPPLHATLACDSEVLNLDAKGQWLNFYVELPEGYAVDSINISSLSLNDSVMADPMFKSVGDHDQNGIPDLLVCFNRTMVQQFILCSGVTTGNVTLSLHGRLDDDSLFESSCTLGARKAGDVNSDGKVDMSDISCVARAFGLSLGQPGWKSVLDENEDNKIDLKDIALVAKSFGKIYS